MSRLVYINKSAKQSDCSGVRRGASSVMPRSRRLASRVSASGVGVVMTGDGGVVAVSEGNEAQSAACINAMGKLSGSLISLLLGFKILTIDMQALVCTKILPTKNC